MKFKLIFILFNFLILFMTIFILLLPVIVFGTSYSGFFIKDNWYLFLFICLGFVVMNVFFFVNWKIFRFLENNDWDNLRIYLEDKIYNKNSLRGLYIKLLCNSYLLNTDIEKINKLRDFLVSKKRNLADKYAYMLGLPYLVLNDPLKMKEYYSAFINNKKSKNHKWILWNYCFALILEKDFSTAADYLKKLVVPKNSDLINKLLALYLFDICKNALNLKDEESDKLKVYMKSKYTADYWDNELKNSGNMQLFILSKLIYNAVDWLCN